jgi:hypothetical protein
MQLANSVILGALWVVASNKQVSMGNELDKSSNGHKLS